MTATQPSVLFINRVYPPAHGASGRVLRDLAVYLSSQGFQVTVLTTGTQKKRYEDMGVTIYQRKASQDLVSMSGYIIVWLKLLCAGLCLKRHDIVISLTDPPLLILAVRLLCFLKRSQHVHWCHDLYPDLFPALNIAIPHRLVQFFKKRVRKAMKSSENVVVIGRCMSKTLTHSGVDVSKISVIPNWAPPGLYEEDQDEILAEKNGKFKIVYAGHLGRAHPVLPVLKAAHALKDQPDIEIIFVGDSMGHERLAQERDRRGLPNIRFIPYQPVSGLRRILKEADMHLVTMRDETAGLLVPCKLYSALAVKRPVLYLGPPETEIDKIIQTYRAGLSVYAHEQDQLSEMILRLYKDTALYQYLQNGAVKAHHDLTPDASMAAWSECLKQISS